MVSFTKATRLGEMAVLSDDFQDLTGRKSTFFRQICEARLARSNDYQAVQQQGLAV